MYVNNTFPGGGANSSPFECGLDLVTSFQRIEYGQGKMVTLQ